MTRSPDPFRDTQRPFPDVCVHALIRERVREAPGAAAVIDGDLTLSYDQLWARAGRVKAALVRRGLGPDHFVRLGLGRSRDLVTAIVGVLRAGLAWVPLDPKYPKDRLRAILDDSAGAPLITDDASIDTFRAHDPAPITMAELLDSPEDDGDDPQVRPEHAAYVIYTSGSTGRPKGVIIEHRSLVNNIHFSAEAFGVRPGVNVLHFSTPCFDVSVWEILAPLVRGACIVVAGEDAARSEAALVALCREQRVEIVFLLASFIAALNPGDFPGVRCVVTGGELFGQSTVDRWSTEDRRVIYVYGPTEATIFQSFEVCPPGRRGEPPTVGLPMPNLRYYVVDEELNLLPPPATGELLIAGVGVGRGYLQRSASTREKFIEDPWMPGQRAYRSGDRVGFRDDGSLDFLGRVDRQMKVRGFRIEPGEVELPLLSHPGVKQAVVTARRSHQGENHLVAYVVPQAALTPRELNDHLLERVPAYMIPSGFMFLDTLPRTPNGKVDRDALPAFVPERAERTPPRNDAERTILEVFREVLGTGEIGVTDDFFLVGGHSLRALVAAAKLSSALGAGVTVRDLFEAPTAEALAERMAARPSGLSSAIPRAPRGPHYPLSHGQHGLWLVDQARGPNALYNVPSVWRVEGALDRARLRDALDRLAARQAALRTRFFLEDGGPRQRALEPEGLDLRVIEVPSAEEAARIVREEINRSFSLEDTPLARAVLVGVAAEDHRLVLTLHHTISDAWSTRVLAEDLGALYRGAALDALPLDYFDYAAWTRTQTHERSLAYWAEKLGRPAAPLSLPTDHPRPAVPSGRGAARQMTLGADVTRAVFALARQARASLFIVLAELWIDVLHRLTGAADISIGTPIAARNDVKLHRLVGLFVNTLVLRTKVDPGASLLTRVEEMKRVGLDAFQHHDCPFDRLVETIDPPRHPGRHPLFDAWLVLLDEATPLALGDGLRTSFEEASPDISLFDLSLQVRETREGRLFVRLQYDTALYQPVTIDLILERFAAAARSALDPSRPIDGRIDAERELAEREDTLGFEGFDFS